MKSIRILACLWAAALFGQSPGATGSGDLAGYLGLNDSQLAQLQQLRNDRERAAEPYRQQALAVLTESQKQKLQALEEALKLCGMAREASRLGLLAPSAGATGPGDAAPGKLRLTGELVAGGVECQRFQSTDGKLYTLTGNLQGFRTGDRVEITGALAQASHCMQDTTIQVDAIRRLP